MGKTGRKNKSYSSEFKISVIMDMREHKLGYNETIRKYWDMNIMRIMKSSRPSHRR